MSNRICNFSRLSSHLRTSLNSSPNTICQRSLQMTYPKLTRHFHASVKLTQTSTPPPRWQEYHKRNQSKNRTGLLYGLSAACVFLGAAFLSAPLYRIFCQKTGYGGTINPDTDRFSPDNMKPIENVKRRIRVTFSADTSDRLPWSLKSQQREVRVLPGETALAFFTATNNGDEDIIGVATYSVSPPQVAEYFSKVACFCFEEQRLNAKETVDLPVFFFIDPEFARDPRMRTINDITLSYTFFKAKYDKSGNIQMPQEGSSTY